MMNSILEEQKAVYSEIRNFIDNNKDPYHDSDWNFTTARDRKRVLKWIDFKRTLCDLKDDADAGKEWGRKNLADFKQISKKILNNYYPKLATMEQQIEVYKYLQNQIDHLNQKFKKKISNSKIASKVWNDFQEYVYKLKMAIDTDKLWSKEELDTFKNDYLNMVRKSLTELCQCTINF